MRIYSFRGKLKLGDTWSQVNWLLQQEGVAVTEGCRSRHANVSAVPLVSEISSLLRTDVSIRFVPGRHGERLPSEECFHCDYLPTKLKWHGTNHRLICVQLDGRWKSHRKNPTPSEKARLIASFAAHGFSVQELGQPMSLSECVAALASCCCFIGVDSGIMHIANSVRCPRILIRNRMFQIENVYRGKGLMLTANADTALSLLLGDVGGWSIGKGTIR